MDRYSTNTKGTSPALSAIINEFASMPRSAFDETRTKDLDVPFFGIIPIECFQMFPNSEGYLRYDIKALTKNPTVARMMSNANIELRTYVCKNSDLWEGWNNFVTRGRSGKVTKKIPYLISKKTVSETTYSTDLPYNPCHYLNIAPAMMYNSDLSFAKNHGIVDFNGIGYTATDLLKTSNYGSKSFTSYLQGRNALPFVMYAKIAKEFQNPNLLQDNENWYPENENHDLILSYSCTKASNATYEKEEYFFNETHDGVTYDEQQPTNDNSSMPWLNILYFKQRKGDYFTTSSPFPDLLRGDIPTLEGLAAKLDFTNSVYTGNASIIADSLIALHYLGGDGAKIGAIHNANPSAVDRWYHLAEKHQDDPNQGILQWHGTDDADQTPVINKIPTDYLLSALNNAQIKGLQFSMNQWRKLATMTVFRERMARCDGSYNQMIMAQFKHNPRWHEHSVNYCGGNVQPIVFSEVVQQSESNTTPLGTTAGRAFSDSQSREIRVKTDDYAIMMTVLTITPNTVYSQGIDRMWSELDQADQYFPILNNLEPQAIKNKELFISGDDTEDEDVFAYQERFSHFKSRQNQVSGLMALPISKVGKTGAYLFNRLFSDTPNFNWDFVAGDMTDNEDLCFSSTSQAPFTLHISSNFKYVAPMPAISQASDMGLSY